GPLDRASALALFDAATPGGAVPAEYREWCVQVADGNPLFVCACAHDATNQRPQEVPPSLTRMIVDRVRAVSTSSWRVLQAVAVLSNAATSDHVIAILGITRHALLDAVRDLSERRLIVAEHGAFACRHALIADS